jgi:hypothetical protein
MGINTSAGSTITSNLRYSAFLGMLHQSNPEIDARIEAAKAKIGEATVKSGFTGNSGASAAARAELAAAGVKPVNISGRLTSVSVKMRLIKGKEQPYLQVGIRDDDGRYFFSVSMNQDGVSMLVRKLVNAQPDVPTILTMFGTYDKNEKDGKFYGNHGASLSQAGKQVPTLAIDDLKASRDAATAGLPASVPSDIRRQIADSAEVTYCMSLVRSIEESFATFYNAKNAQNQSARIAA